MGQNRLPDLNAAQLVLVDLADHIAHIEFEAVQKLHRLIAAINALDDIIVAVFFQFVGVGVQVIPFAHNAGAGAHAGGAADIKLQAGFRCAVGEVEPFEIHIPFGRGRAGGADALDCDLFDQVPVVCLDRIQPVDHVVAFAGRGGIAQGEQRMEFFQPLFGLLALHALRFVNDQDWVSFGNDVDRTPGLELVQFHIDAAGVLAAGVERLRVDDHGRDGVLGGELLHLGQLGRVVDKVADLLAVLLGKVFLGDGEGFVDALADGDAGHHDDKLAPAVALVQLVHRFDVGIGFADASLHLNGEVVAALQLFGRGQAVGKLYTAEVLENGGIRQFRYELAVAPAERVEGDILRPAGIAAAALVQQVLGRSVGLTGKHLADSIGRIGLEFLVAEL